MSTFSALLSILGLFSAGSQAAVLATYEFTGGSLTPTLTATATSNGITVSDLSGAATYNDGDGDLDLKDANNAAVQGADTAHTGTGAAITASNWMTFSVSIPSGVTIDLDTISFEIGVDNFWGNGSPGGHMSRVFSSIDGTDAVSDDTIGRVGFLGGSNNTDRPIETQTLGLSDPTGNINNGANVTGDDFQGLTNTTVTFYLPWIDNSSSGTRAVILDDIVINGTIIPEPSTALLSGLAFLGLLRRRR